MGAGASADILRFMHLHIFNTLSIIILTQIQRYFEDRQKRLVAKVTPPVTGREIVASSKAIVLKKRAKGLHIILQIYGYDLWICKDHAVDHGIPLNSFDGMLPSMFL